MDKKIKQEQLEKRAKNNSSNLVLYTLSFSAAFIMSTLVEDIFKYIADSSKHMILYKSLFIVIFFISIIFISILMDKPLTMSG
jgi:hypothetical protein